MCHINGPFKLCTCSEKVLEKFKNLSEEEKLNLKK